MLDEAHSQAGGLMGMLAALASGTLELLVGAVGVDAPRATLNLAIHDAEMDGDDSPVPTPNPAGRDVCSRGRSISSTS